MSDVGNNPSDATRKPADTVTLSVSGGAAEAAMRAAEHKDDHSNDGGLNLLKLGAESFVRSAVVEPVRGLTQLANQVPGVNIKTFDAPKQPQAAFGTNAWYAETIGSGLGMVAPFLLTERLTSATFGSRLTGVSKAMVDGGIYGFALTPSDDPTRNFWEQRAVAGVSGGLTFGTQHALAGKVMGMTGLAEDAAFARSWQGIGTRLGANAFSGGVAGVVSAESNSLLSGRGLASADEVKQSAAAFVVTGLGMDAMHMAGERYSEHKAAKQGGSDATTAAPQAHTLQTDGAFDNVRGAIAGSLPLTAAVVEARAIGSRFGMPHVEAAPTHELGLLPPAPKIDIPVMRVADMNPPTRIDEMISPPTRAKASAEVTAEIRNSARDLKYTVDQQLTGLDPAVARLHKSDVQRTIDEVVARRRDVSDPAEMKQSLDAVNDFLRAPKLQVDLEPWQRVAVVKQMLAEIADPRMVAQGTDLSCGPTLVQEMALLNNPGKQMRAVVDILTNGRTTLPGERGGTIDLSRATLENIDKVNALPDNFRSSLQPDAQSLATLQLAGQPGAPATIDGARSYVSQITQLINGNIKSQLLAPEGERAIYVKGKPNPLMGDSGERLVHLEGEQQYRPVVGPDGRPKVGPGIESRDLQPMYDALTGRDSRQENFVLLNTKEALDASQGSRFLSPVELERLLVKGNRPFAIEVNPNHPTFNDGVDMRGKPGSSDMRHVVLVEAARDARTGDPLMQGTEPIFNVIDNYGRARDLTGFNGLTAKELYEATLHDNDPRRVESPSELPGVRNFGKVDEGLYRGRRPDSYEGIKSLKNEGVTLIIDLIENPVMRDSKTREEVWANRAGVKYENIKTSVKNFDSEHVQKVLDRIDEEVQRGGKVFIHCARGADRTGAIVAFWRTAHGWSSRQALAEMREYNWSERMHYGSRMGSMVEHANQQEMQSGSEVRDIGNLRQPFQEANAADRLGLLSRTRDLVIRKLGEGRSNQDSVYHVIEDQLQRTGLAKDGWQAFPTVEGSPADAVGADFFLINTRNGETFFLDATANKNKGQAGSNKEVPAIRADGLITFDHRHFDYGKVDITNPDAVDWSRSVGDQLTDIVRAKAPFNISNTPLPDFRPLTADGKAQEVRTFADWLSKQEGRDYRDYASSLRRNALKHAEGVAAEFRSPELSNSAQRAAEDAMVDWALAQMGRSKSTQQPGGKQQSNVRTFTDKYDASRTVLKLQTSDGRQADGGSVGEILDKARLDLGRKLQDHGKPVSTRPGAAPVEQLPNRIIKKLEAAGVKPKELADYLHSHQQVIRNGGKLGQGPAELTNGLVRILSNQSEARLLGEEVQQPVQQPQAKAEPKAEVPPPEPYKGLDPLLEFAKPELQDLGINRSSNVDDVATALGLIFESGNTPPDVLARLHGFVDDFRAGKPAAIAKVAALLPPEGK